MKRAAILLAVLLASPAWAADQWNALSLGGSGPTWSSPVGCYPAGVYEVCVRLVTTTYTSSIKQIDFTTPTSPTVGTFSIPTLLNTDYVLLYGGDSSTIFVGGAISDGFDLQHASMPLSGTPSWTRDASHATGDNTGTAYLGRVYASGLDATYPWTVGYAFHDYNNTVDRVGACNFKIGSFATSGCVYFTGGGIANFNSGLRYSSGALAGGLYGYMGRINNGTRAGSTSLSAANKYAATGTLTSGTTKPAFGYTGNGTWTFGTGMNGSDTTIWGMNGSANSYQIDVTIASKTLVPGADCDPTGSLRRAWWFSTDGKAYRTNNASPTTVAADTTYDIPSGSLGGGSVNAVTCDRDMNGDSRSDLLVTLTTGNAVWFGSAPSSGGPRAPARKVTGPFNNLPFRGP